MRKKWLSTVVSVLVACSLLMGLTGCLSTGAAETAPPSEEIQQPSQPVEGEKTGEAADETAAEAIVETDEWASVPEDWNPHTWYTAADGAMFDYLVTPLVTNVTVDGEYIFTYRGATAVTDITKDFADKEAWGIDADAEEGHVFQVDLNPELTWDDGTAINADSYIYSMQVLLDPAMGNYRSGGYVNSSQGQQAIKGAFGYNNNDKIGEVIYRDVLDAEISDDEPVYLVPTAGCLFFGGYSLEYYYNTVFKVYFTNNDGVDLYEKYAASGEPVELTDDNRDEMIEDLLTLASFFGDNNPEAWVEFFVYADGVYEDTPWENVGLYKTGDSQLVYITENPVDVEDLTYSFRRNWLVNEAAYEANMDTEDGYTYTMYNTDAETTASYGPYTLVSFDEAGMVMEKNENWYGWADESLITPSDADILEITFPQEEVAANESEEKTSGGETTEPGETHPFPYAFEAENIFGETVTQDDIGEKEIFFVHLWATWCGPCIAEMGELAEIVEMYGDRVGFLGLLHDYDDGINAAKKLADLYGTFWNNIHSRTPELDELYQMIRSGYVPTTVIIDGDGNLIGEQIVGERGMDYADLIEAALKEVANR